MIIDYPKPRQKKVTTVSEVIPVNALNPEQAEDLSIQENGLGIPASAPIMMDDDLPADSQDKKTQLDEAFTARPFFWKHFQLAPFAIDREADWLRHRVMLQEPTLDELIREPNAMMADVARVLWFLTHEPEEWLALPSMKQLGEAEDYRWVKLAAFDRAMSLELKIRAWSAEHIHHSEAVQALALFYDIYNRAQSTRATSRPSPQHDASREKK
jgi:hypothetical protein